MSQDILVSVIIPYCQEWPQVGFTVRSIHEELKGIPHEIVVADNFCHQVLEQMWKAHAKGLTRYIDEGHRRPSDKCHEPPSHEWLEEVLTNPASANYCEGRLESNAKKYDWLQWVSFPDKLSHWNAKNTAVAVARGRLLLFLDAHVVPARGSISRMVRAYDRCTEENGPCSLHAPLTYHILEEHRLIYKLVHNPERGELHYSFTGYPNEWDIAAHVDTGLAIPQEVPCMSCCGVLISRDVYDALGGWPLQMGIYGGGENFLNFTMAVLGMKHFIMPGPPVHHYATHRGRGYHWEWGDHKKNQAIANFMFGGTKWLENYCRLHPKYARVPDFFEHLIPMVYEECRSQRWMIKSQQKMEIEEWIAAHSLST